MVAAVLPALITGGASIFGASQQADAAKDAQAAQQQAIDKAIGIAREGHAANTANINQYSGIANQQLNSGVDKAVEYLDPLLQTGDKAVDYYANASGVNGEDARNKYMQNLMARPEYAAAREAAQGQVQQRYGNKLGSGALARSMMERDQQFASQYADKDLARVRPLTAMGTETRSRMAGLEADRGTQLGNNSWRTMNAFMDSQNALTGAAAGGAVASGRAAADSALQQGNAWSGAMKGLGNAFGQVSQSPSFQSAFNNNFS